MIFDRIMLPAQGRNEDYKFAQTGSVALVASVGGAGGIEPTPSWLENVIKLDPESGFLSVDNWHVKGDLIIEGQVNQWLAQQLVVDDARIQVNRRQDGAIVDSGLVIFDKDTSSEVSSLVYDVAGVWKAGGDRLFTEAYNPKLGGYAAGDYPRKTEDAVITGKWTFSNFLNGNLGIGITPTERLHVAGNGLFTGGLTAGGNVSAPTFVSGFAGSGWRLEAGAENHLTVDRLTVRGRMDVYELAVNQIRGTNGAQWVSDSAKVASVSGNRLTIDTGGDTSFVPFVVNDLLRCQRWNGKNIKYYVVRVTAVGSNYIDVVLVDGSSPREAGDYLVRMGNTEDTDRQGALYLTSSDSNAPYMDVLDGVNSASFAGKTKVRIGRLDGITDPDLGTLSGYGLYTENGYFKGKIQVTGGNAATKEDVDAIQVGGRNLILNSSFVRGYDNWGTTGGSGQTIATGASDYPSMSPVKRSAKWTNTAEAGQGIVSSKTDSWTLFENGKEYVITCWVKASSASTFSLQVYGDSGDVASSFKAFSVNTNWQKIVHIVKGDGQSNPRVRFFGRNNGVTYWVNCPKVEIGNKATDWTPAPEDVDAAIDNIEVGGRNLVEKTNQGATNIQIDSSAGSRTWTVSEEIVDGVRCAKGTKNTTAVETWSLFNLRIYTPSKFRANQQYAISFKMKPSFAVSNRTIRLSTNTNQALSTNSDTYSLVAGEWNHIKLVVTTLPDFDTILAGRGTVHLRLGIEGNSSTGDTVLLKDIKIEEGNKATDWTPAPEDVPSALDYLAEAIQDGSTDIEGGLINTNVLMVKDTNGEVSGGISGLASDNIGFWTGGSYQDAINGNANVIFRKDGSISLAGGKIIGTSDGSLFVDAGVITGVIESANYDGIVGSRFDLYNGHLLIGDAIQMSGDTSEILVRNRDTGLDSLKIGDFPLSTEDLGAGVDVLLSSSPVTASPASGSYQLNRTVYISGTGALVTSTVYVSNSLIVGGAYSFETKLKVTLSSYDQLYTVIGMALDEKFEWIAGNGIKMQLKNGNTVVWEQNIKAIPENGVIPLFISTSFQATSPLLQLIIIIDGEYRYRIPAGTNTRLYNTTASISRFDSSSRLVLRALISRMEFSTRGMQTVFSSINYFKCSNTGIEGRGVQTFISPNGTYRLRISNNGIEKSTNGGTTWTTL